MRTTAGRTAFLLITIILSAVSIWAQGVNTIQGRVIAPDGGPPTVPVRVTLTFSGRRIYETFTDLSGRFIFSGLIKGTYQLTAASDGLTFEDTTVYAEVSVFGGGPQLFTQDIQLRPLKTKATHAGVLNAFNQDVPKAAREKFARAQKLLSESKGELAMIQLQEAVKIFPNYFDANLQIGNQLIQTGHLDEAIPPLDKAREVNPNDERVYQSFGLIMMKQRKYPVAVAIFEEAARLNPVNPLNPLMRASALIYQASYVDPASVTVRRDLLSQAEVSINKASDLSEKRVKPDALTLAMFYELKGNPSRAADELESYLKKTPAAKNAEAIQQEITRLRSKPSAP